MTKQQELKSQILSDLLSLQGSEKQVAWAMKIRQAWVGDMKAMFRDIDNPDFPSAQMPPLHELQKLVEKHNQTSPSWWIDNRHGATTRQRGY